MSMISTINDVTLSATVDLKVKLRPQGLKFEYIDYLQQYSFLYEDDQVYYKIGNNINDEWELFLSIMAAELPDLLSMLLPLLSTEQIPFRIVKNRNLHYHLNNGDFGLQFVGKVILIYPENKNEAINISNKLLSLTAHFRGPALSNCFRLGKILYSTHLDPRKKSSNPFVNISALFGGLFRNQNKKLVFRSKKVIGRHYRPIQKFRFSPKGEIHKGINMRDLTWCIIKRGRYCAFEDDFGRNIRDRLYWQYVINKQLENYAPVQKVIDYIEEEEDTYLILEYLEGKHLRHAVKEKNPNYLPWKELGLSNRTSILGLFIEALDALEKLHLAGIVHRDLTEGNFILVPYKGMHIIDLELAYDVFNQRPAPPFYPGAPQFRAPEQNEIPINNFKEDIFSLGSLYSYLLTSWVPECFFEEDRGKVEQKLFESTENNRLTKLILDCTQIDPTLRPELSSIRAILKSI